MTSVSFKIGKIFKIIVFFFLNSRAINSMKAFYKRSSFTELRYKAVHLIARKVAAPLGHFLFSDQVIFTNLTMSELIFNKESFSDLDMIRINLNLAPIPMLGASIEPAFVNHVKLWSLIFENLTSSKRNVSPFKYFTFV